MKQITLHTFRLLLVLLLPTMAVHTANAQTGFGIGKSILDFEIPAGTSHADSILIVNNSDSAPLPISIDLLLWNLKEDADDIEFVRAEEGLNATQWFDIETTDFILEPSGSREVKFTVSPPVSTSPGSYFVMMRFQPALPDFYFKEEGPRFIPEAGALFFLKVPFLSLDERADAHDAEIVSLKPGGANKISIINNFLPEANAGAFDGAVKSLVAEIANTGIFHFKASGNIKVENVFGRTVAEAEIPNRFLLPDRTRPIETIILPPPETESLSFINRFIKKAGYSLKTNTYFGPYTAIVTLSVPGEVPVVESVNFWVIPWQFWLILSFIATGMTLIVKRGRGRFSTAFRILLKRNKTTI